MDRKTLAALIKSGESETLELKKSLAELEAGFRAVCAFLNGQGGMVVFGVAPQGRVTGQPLTDGNSQKLAAAVRKLEPPAVVTIAAVELEPNKPVIVVRVSASKDSIPVVFDGKAYQKIGSTVSVMPQEAYQRLLLQRVHAHKRWETEPAEGVSAADLDQEELQAFFNVAASRGRLPQSQGESVDKKLERLGLSRNGQLVNAAVVLFGKKFLPDYPQCKLRLASFKGVDKSSFLDQKQLHGHAFQVLEESLAFLRRHLPVAGRIQPGQMEREDTPLFPLEALREALVNAICHRDYTVAGGAISVAVFDNRLEIANEGLLPFGQEVADLKRDHLSRPRNPLIAEVFYLRGLVEQWGRGTQKIVELCVQAGHPEPDFLQVSHSTMVRFTPSGYVAPHRVPHDLSQRQREILHALAQAADLALSEVLVKLPAKAGKTTVRDDLTQLRTLGLVDVRGKGRGSRWHLKDGPKE